jgi:Ca2+-binding EF-hand superfamily protein
MKHIKNRVIAFAVLLIPVISCISLFSQVKTRQGSSAQVAGESFDLPSFFNKLDADRDGFVSKQEWSLFFSAQDTDGDQRLSLDEIGNALHRLGKEAASDSDSGRIAAFERLDVNKNGKIDPREWPGKAKDFRFLDANHDGFLSLEEFLSPRGRWRNETFENLDFNGDKVISHSEWLDSNESFDKLDRDHNGVIDRNEFYDPR